MKLEAKVGDQVCDSATFTVCAHPKNFAVNSFLVGLNYGLKTKLSWESETGSSCSDLNKCELTEYLDRGVIPNPPFHDGNGGNDPDSLQQVRLPSTPIAGTYGDKNTVTDTHARWPSSITTPPVTGSYMIDQDYDFRCLRCNSGWTKLESYLIVRWIYDDDESNGVDLRFRTECQGTGGPFLSDEDISGY
jgi:hypothetical protein